MQSAGIVIEATLSYRSHVSENAGHRHTVFSQFFWGGRAMKYTLISAIGLAFLLTWARPVPAQDAAAQLVGVWKYTNINIKQVATGKISYPFGENPTGHIVY